VKKISEKQNDTEKIFSKEIKITDEEMRRNYDKFLVMAFFGFVIVPITLIPLMISYIAIFLLIPLGIAIGAYGLYGIYLHKRKPEKYREILERKKIFSKEIKITDEEMRRNYDKFLVMAFFGFVIVPITLIPLMISYIAIFLLIPLGIAIGAYGLYGIYLHKRKPEKYREILERKKSWRRNIELVKKRSKILFMVGTYIIGLAILVIWVDLVFMPRGGWRGFYALVVSPVYFFGLLLVVYSIHLIGNKWGWLNFPIAIVIFIVAIFIMIFSYAYRLAWFLAFPLNYVVLLIQFLTSINKDFNH